VYCCEKGIDLVDGVLIYHLASSFHLTHTVIACGVLIEGSCAGQGFHCFFLLNLLAIPQLTYFCNFKEIITAII
jgi:hypothetical protein